MTCLALPPPAPFSCSFRKLGADREEGHAERRLGGAQHELTTSGFVEAIEIGFKHHKIEVRVLQVKVN